ncbi:MAG: hypothetical protein ABI614_29675, partial [Planctomycetota bacterium]
LSDDQQRTSHATQHHRKSETGATHVDIPPMKLGRDGFQAIFCLDPIRGKRTLPVGELPAFCDFQKAVIY